MPEKVLANEPETRYNALKHEIVDELQAKTTTNQTETEGIAHGTDIRKERGLPDTRPDSEQRAGGTAGQVRSDAEELPGEAPEGNFQRDADDGQFESALSGDTETGRGKNGSLDRADGEIRGSGRGAESRRSDEMGGQDEQHQAISGGDSPDGAGLRPISSKTQKNIGTENPDSGDNLMSLKETYILN